MYQHQVEPFGKFEKHTIAHANTGNSFAFVPAYSACLLDIQLAGQSILDGYQNDQELDFNRWYKNQLLYPYPNRLAEGAYFWEGKDYYFPINDATTNNSLHGLGADKVMRVNQLSLEAERAAIGCVYESKGDNPAYPFPYSCSVVYEITDDGTFSLELSLSNKSEQDIPLGLGWHPYFKIADKIDQVKLRLPACDLIGVNDKMLPTGKRYAYDAFQELELIGSEVLDNCFAIKESLPTAIFQLEGERGRLTVRQHNHGNFGFFQVFTPPHRSSIALEPMTCNINAFNNGEGLLRVAPGEAGKLAFSIAYQNKSL